MSKEEDIAFCKIALQAGLLEESAAKRCLVLADRFESQGKERPTIGALLVKSQAMSQTQVRQVYQALAKRAARNPAPAAAGSRRGRAAAVAAPAAEPRRRGGRRGAGATISQGMLWTYIGSAAALVALIIAMVVMVVRGNKKKPAEVAAKPAVEALAPAAPASVPAAATPAPAAPAAPASKDSTSYKKFNEEHRTGLTDATADLGDRQYGRAIKRLKDQRERLATGYGMWPEDLQALEAEIKRAEERMASEVAAAKRRADELVAAGKRSDALQILDSLIENVDEKTRSAVEAMREEVQKGGN